MDLDVSDKVLICGGGIGGLALGVALAKVRAAAPCTLRPVWTKAYLMSSIFVLTTDLYLTIRIMRRAHLC